MTDDDQSARQAADQRTLLALMLIVMSALALLALMALVMPQFLGLIVVVGGMILFGTAHYVTWGWWLPRYLRRQEQNTAASETPPRKE